MNDMIAQSQKIATHSQFSKNYRTTFFLIDNYYRLYPIPTKQLGIEINNLFSIYSQLNHYQISLFQTKQKRNKIVSRIEPHTELTKTYLFNRF